MAIIKTRGYTEADWLVSDPVLNERELGLILDTGEYVIGDASTAFSGLTRYAGSRVATVEEATTSRTLGLLDASKVIECINAAATTITVPPNSSVAFPVGTLVSIYAAGAGGLTIVEGAGVTIRNLTPLSQYGETSLRKRDTDEWVQA